MSLLYHGDIAPHLAQHQRERGEPADVEVVGQVEETDFPMKEEVEMLTDKVGGKELAETEDSPAVGKTPTGKSNGEDSMEVKTFPIQPLIPSPGQYGEQEYELLSWMADQDSLFSHPPLPPVPHPLQLDDLFDPYILPSVSMPTPSIVTSDLKPVALSPPPSTVVPAPPPMLPKLNKNKKKLSKHHVKSFKYAPGDYTEVPVIRLPESNAAAASARVNPYRSFIISSALDYRLQYSLELPTELALQVVARDQYEAVLQALVSAGPPGEGGEEGGSREEKGRGRAEMGLENVCIFIQDSLRELLALVTDPQPSVDKMALLSLWSEFNSLLMAWCPPPLPPPRGKEVPSGGWGSKTYSEPSQSKENEFPSLCSADLLVSLTACLSGAPSTAATWQIGLSLLHQIISLLSLHTSSLPLHPSQLSHLLLAYFLSGDDLDVGVARGVVSVLLKQVLPLQLVGTITSGSEEPKEGGEGMTGAHILLEVLVQVLEQR